MKINFFDFFRKRNFLQNVFPVKQFNVVSGSASTYPLFLSLEKDSIYAYSARFMIRPEELSVVEKMVGLFFHGKLTEEKRTFSDHDKILICYKFKEFEQDVVRLITNDNNFITHICEKGLEPPRPEDVFSDRDLSAYGSLQGDMEFWWDTYWRPFWENLTSDEKIRYLKRSDLSEDTIKFLKYRN